MIEKDPTIKVLDSAHSILLVTSRDRVWYNIADTIEENLPAKVIGPVEDQISALALIKAWHPVLVILEINSSLIPSVALEILTDLKLENPICHCIVLSDNPTSSKEIINAGADLILSRNFSFDDIFSNIRKYIS